MINESRPANAWCALGGICGVVDALIGGRLVVAGSGQVVGARSCRMS